MDMIEFQTTSPEGLWGWYDMFGVRNLTALHEKRYPSGGPRALNTFPGDILEAKYQEGGRGLDPARGTGHGIVIMVCEMRIDVMWVWAK